MPFSVLIRSLIIYGSQVNILFFLLFLFFFRLLEIQAFLCISMKSRGTWLGCLKLLLLFHSLLSEAPYFLILQTATVDIVWVLSPFACYTVRGPSLDHPLPVSASPAGQ